MTKKLHDDLITADAEWWRNILPPGWTMVGFTFRDTAFVRKTDQTGSHGHSATITGPFMCAMRGLDWEKEQGIRGY